MNRVRSSALALALVGCVALSPKMLQEDLARLDALAQQADKTHGQKCTPPPAAGPPPPRPEVCEALEACANKVQEAAHTCRDAIRGAADGAPLDVYRTQAGECRLARNRARQRCLAAKLEVPPWP